MKRVFQILFIALLIGCVIMQAFEVRSLLCVIESPRDSSPENTPEDNPSAMIARAFSNFTNEELAPFLKLWGMAGDDHRDFAMDVVKQINEKGIEGDIVECGVWKGGVSMAMAIANQRHNTRRHLWLFDTFQGLPAPTEIDGGHADNTFKQIAEFSKTGKASGWVEQLLQWRHVEDGKFNYGPLDVVRNNMYYTGYPKDKIHFVEGKVEDTLKSSAIALPEKIAVLRLDTDWYESTKIEMEVLYPRLQSGGILLVDDYCFWPGSQEAIKEYFNKTLGLDSHKLKEGNPPCFHYWKP